MFFFPRSGIKILRNFQPDKVKPVSIHIHRTASHLISREKIMPPFLPRVLSCIYKAFHFDFNDQVRHTNAIFQSNCNDCSILFYACRAVRKAFACVHRGKMKGAPRRLNIAAELCMTVCLKIRFTSYAALHLPQKYLSQPDGGIYHKKPGKKSIPAASEACPLSCIPAISLQHGASVRPLHCDEAPQRIFSAAQICRQDTA